MALMGDIVISSHIPLDSMLGTRHCCILVAFLYGIAISSKLHHELYSGYASLLHDGGLVIWRCYWFLDPFGLHSSKILIFLLLIAFVFPLVSLWFFLAFSCIFVLKGKIADLRSKERSRKIPQPRPISQPPFAIKS